MNLKSLVWQETVQIHFALKTFTGLSPGLIIPYFYYFHHALIYKAHGCGTVQVWLGSLSLTCCDAASGVRGMMSWWFSWPCPARCGTQHRGLHTHHAGCRVNRANPLLHSPEHFNSMQFSSQCSHLSLNSCLVKRMSWGWQGGTWSLLPNSRQ